MADSATLRVQRHRRHVANDHSLCLQSRCAAAGRAAVVEAPPSREVAGGLDPARELQASAVRLVAACQADPANAVLARELRQTLAMIPRAEGASPLDAIRQRAWLKQLGWAPGDDPELQDLAAELVATDPVAFLRHMAEEVP